jgi:hypothetical protein
MYHSRAENWNEGRDFEEPGGQSKERLSPLWTVESHAKSQKRETGITTYK